LEASYGGYGKDRVSASSSADKGKGLAGSKSACIVNLPHVTNAANMIVAKTFINDVAYSGAEGGGGGYSTDQGSNGSSPVATNEYRIAFGGASGTTCYHTYITPTPGTGDVAREKAGSGAASVLGHGGQGGMTGEEAGGNGYYGSGGGGAKYKFGVYNRGGKGGDGAILFFY
jgi:hypothetical protein